MGAFRHINREELTDEIDEALNDPSWPVPCTLIFASDDDGNWWAKASVRETGGRCASVTCAVTSPELIAQIEAAMTDAKGML